MARATRKRLGEMLIEGKVLSEDQVLEALHEQRQTGELLGEALVRMGLVTEDTIAGTITVQRGIPYIPVLKYRIPDDVVNIFPAGLLEQYQFVPVDRMGRVLIVAAGGLLTDEILRELESLAGCRIHVYVARPSEVKDLIKTRFAGAEPSEPAAAAPAETQDKLSGLGSMLLGDEE
jgi:type IV pilus assembly protein PilB